MMPKSNDRIDLGAGHIAAADEGDAPSNPAATVQARPVSECPGMVIGAYKLLEQIGEGGFGIVFMAEQQQPIRRKVAVKVLKPGMDTRQVIARFEAERQALALMDHPNIARVFDGGETAAGRPYFVMELVKGIPVTDYCDQGNLATRDRLELFIQVCQAVQHAHQKGIIHRDLKPSNVLVTLLDGAAVPKVIDFGIAKATGQQLTDKTLFTNFAQLLGTPMYMSPEQAALSGVDVDTRSDIYSLGVLLYELLTGTTPFDKERFQTAGYDEIRRIIREEEPPRPSTRETRDEGRGAKKTAGFGSSRPSPLASHPSQELDWIVMKCLDKDRNRRYETANSLARDIERYLRDEPVQACPPSALYRLRKFARRNKRVLAPVVAAAVAVFVGLLLTVALLASHAVEMKEEQERTGMEYNRAEAALRQAEGNLQRADHNLTLALEALDRVYMKGVEDRILRDRNMTKVERASLEKGLKFYERFAQQNSGHGQLKQVTAKAYQRAGFLRLELGDWKEADAYFSKAIPVLEQLAERSPDKTDFRQEVARCLDGLSTTRIRACLYPKAELTCRQAISVWQKLAADFPKEPRYRADLAGSLLQLGRVAAFLDTSGRREQAEKAMRQALELYEALATEYPDQAWYRQEAAWGHSELAHYVLAPSGRARAAAESLKQAIAIYQSLAAESPNNLNHRQSQADRYIGLGDRLKETGQLAQAEEAYSQALRTYQKLLADAPTGDYQLRVGWTYVSLGTFFRETRQLNKAEKAYRQGFDVYTKLIADTSTHPSAMWRLPAVALDLGRLLQGTGRVGEARQILHQAADKCRTALSPYDKWPAERNLPGNVWDYKAAYRQLGDVLREVGRFQEAAEAYRQALAIHQRILSNSPTAADYRLELADIHATLGDLWRDGSRPAEAEKAYRSAVEIHAKVAAESPSLYGVGRLAIVAHELGNVLQTAGQRLEADRICSRAVRDCRTALERCASSTPDHKRRDYRWHLASDCEHLGRLLQDQRKIDEAVKAYQDAQALWVKLVADSNSEDDRWHLAQNYETVGHLLKKTARLDEAADAYRQAVAVWNKLVSELGKEDHRNHVTWNHGWLLEALLHRARQVETDGTLSRVDRKAAAPRYRDEARELLRQGIKRGVFTANSLKDVAWRLDNDPRPENRDPAWALEVAKLAAGLYEKLVTDAPGEASLYAQVSDALLSLGHLVRRNGSPQEAEKLYRQSLALGQKVANMSPAKLWHAHMPAACYYHLGDLLLETKRHKEAEETYKRAIEEYQPLLSRFPEPSYIQGETADVVQNLARVLKAIGKTADARDVLQDGIKRGLCTTDSLNGMAWRLATDADPEKRDPAWALELAKLAVEQAPDNAGFLNTLGATYYRAGAWSKAIETLKQADEIHGSSQFSHDAFFIAMARWRMGDKEGARKWYTAATRWMDRFAPKNEELLRFRGEAAALLGLPVQSPAEKQKPADDRQLYTLILAANPEAAWAYVERAQIEKSRGQTQEAEADFSRAIALYTRAIEETPQDGQHWFSRGNAYAELAQWDKASADLAKASAAKDAGPILWYRHALLRLHLGDRAGYRKACAVILERFSKKANNGAPLGAWNCVLAPNAVDDYVALVQWAEKIVAAGPGDFVHINTLGAALYRAGRFDEAVTRLNEAHAAYKPDDNRTPIAYICWFLAMAHHRLGHAAEARQWLDKAVTEIDGRDGKTAAGRAASVPWNRRLTLGLLRREAEALMNGKRSGD